MSNLVSKQCQGPCGRVKRMPEQHVMCGKCFQKMQRDRHKDRVAEAWREGYETALADVQNGKAA